MSVATAQDRPDVPVPEPSERRRARLARVEWALMAVLVVVPVVLIWRFASPSFFFGDDMYNLFQAHNSHFGLSYLFDSAIGHLSPGYRLAYVVIDRLFPMNFEVALAFLVACQATSAVLLQRILALVFGRVWWTYVLALAWAVSIVYLPALEWFAAGILSIPAITATLASIHGYLCWRATGRRGWLLWSLVAMAIGLGFYAKVILVPLYLVLMRVLLLDPEVPLRDSLRSVRREWRVWAAYGAVCAVYLIVYELGPYERVRGGESLGTILNYLRVLWVEGFWPMAFGVYVPTSHHSEGQQLAIVAVQVLLFDLVVWSIARRRSAWRAWAFLVIAMTANALLLINRVLFGPGVVGHHPRYFTELAMLVPFALAFAFAMPRLRARTFPVGKRPSPPNDSELRLPSVRGGLAAAFALAVYLGATLATTEAFSDPRSPPYFISSGRLARAYFDHMRADLAAARRAGQQPSLRNGDVPLDVEPRFFNFLGTPTGVRYTALSSIVPIFDDRVTFDQPRWLYVVRPDGHLRPVRSTGAGPLIGARGGRWQRDELCGRLARCPRSPTG